MFDRYLKDNVDGLVSDVVEQFPCLFAGLCLHERLVSVGVGCYLFCLILSSRL